MLRQALALNPSNLEALQVLAAYFKHEEEFEQLLELISHIKSYNEEDALLIWYEAAAYKGLEEYETAALRYRDIAAYFATDEDFLEEYANFQLEIGKREEAIRQYEKLVELNPSRTDIQELLLQLQE